MMKKTFALLLAVVLLFAFGSAALADYHALCGGRALGEWMIYTPDESINTTQNFLSIQADKIIRNGRDCYAFPIDDKSFYLLDWYGAGSDKAGWHVFTVTMGPDFNTMFVLRPTTETANLYLRK